MARTNDLAELVCALETVDAELEFQIERVRKLDGRTADEAAHLADLVVGYGQSRKYLGILLNYQRSRLARRAGPREATVIDERDGTAFSVEG